MATRRRARRFSCRCSDIDALHAELQRKDYKYGKPGVEALPWGKVLETVDPFGNRIRFCESPKEEARGA
jgi:hypothetical protein